MKEFINKIKLLKDKKALDALSKLNSGGVQIALVVDENDKLIGTISDGDIRRSLLNKKSLDSSVLEIMNPNFFSIQNNEPRRKAMDLMEKHYIKQIPILNSKGEITDLVLSQEFSLKSEERENPVVIMAGGIGKRLRPYTENCPKPMLCVGDKPILESLLEKLIESGFKNFFISVNYLKEQIIDYFKDGSSMGIQINYLIEEKPLGTAGSLSLMPKNIQHPFIVMNGDILTKFEPNKLIDFHNENNAYASVCVREHETNVPFGVIESKGIELKQIIEKPTYRDLVSAGVYTFEPEIIRSIPKNAYLDIPDLILYLKKVNKRVLICPIHEYWLDIGRHETLKEADKSWLN